MMKLMSTRLTKESTTGGDKEKKDVGEGNFNLEFKNRTNTTRFSQKGHHPPLAVLWNLRQKNTCCPVNLKNFIVVNNPHAYMLRRRNCIMK